MAGSVLRELQEDSSAGLPVPRMVEEVVERVLPGEGSARSWFLSGRRSMTPVLGNVRFKDVGYDVCGKRP